MILHRRRDRLCEADVRRYGEWVWCWRRRIGDYVVVCQWMRQKVERDHATYHVTWRTPDNALFDEQTYANEPGW